MSPCSINSRRPDRYPSAARENEAQNGAAALEDLADRLVPPGRAVARKFVNGVEGFSNCIKPVCSEGTDLKLTGEDCHELLKRAFVPTSLMFAGAIHGASRVFRHTGPPTHSRRLRPRNSIRKSCSKLSRYRLYPDRPRFRFSASTYPRVVEAESWMQRHAGLKGDKTCQGSRQQEWDPSVKAMVQFPSVSRTGQKISLDFVLGEAMPTSRTIANTVPGRCARGRELASESQWKQETVIDARQHDHHRTCTTPGWYPSLPMILG